MWQERQSVPAGKLGFVKHRLMAALANGNVMRCRVLRTIRLVRIVAGKARHLARPEACRHTQSITGMRDLETVPLSRGAVEQKLVIAHRLAGPEGIDVAVVAANLVRRQTAAGFEMALHADFQLAIPAKTCRVDDRLPDFFLRSVGRERCTHVRGSRSVAPLAINPFRNWVGEERKAGITAFRIAALQRQPVVTQQALAGDCAAKVLLPRAIISGAHRPIA